MGDGGTVEIGVGGTGGAGGSGTGGVGLDGAGAPEERKSSEADEGLKPGTESTSGADFGTESVPETASFFSGIRSTITILPHFGHGMI